MSDEIIYKCTDAGNAERIADMLKGEYLYIPEMRAWLKDTGKSWEEDSANLLVQDVIKCLRQAQGEAFKIEDDDRRSRTIKWLLASESQQKIRAAISLMSSVPHMCARISQFDNDDMLLFVQNGVVDLRTGKLRERSKEDFNTKVCNVSYMPDAKSELFEKFINEIMESDHEKIKYLQKLFGYCLTGKITEEEFYQFKGSGGNGKTKLMETIQFVLGNYASTASPDVLMAKDISGIPNDIARLNGARLVVMSEPDVGKKFSDNAIKSLTGGDTCIARFLHKEYFEFKMKGKMILLTNHEIRAISADNGFWRRMVSVPFNYQVPDEKRDKDLQEKLYSQYAAVFAWLVDGCLLWQKEGLKQPQELIDAKKEYRENQDAVGVFLNDCCIEDSNSKIGATKLYNAYKEWCQNNGEYELNQRQFGTRLKEKGFNNRKIKISYWFGIKLVDQVDLVDQFQTNSKIKNLYKDLPEKGLQGLQGLPSRGTQQIHWKEVVDNEEIQAIFSE
jgi:putative DNA primase/helicase